LFKSNAIINEKIQFNSKVKIECESEVKEIFASEEFVCCGELEFQ
jgi:hypothetical protein